MAERETDFAAEGSATPRTAKMRSNFFFNVTEPVSSPAKPSPIAPTALIGRTNRLDPSDQSRLSDGPIKAIRATEQGLPWAKTPLTELQRDSSSA